MKGPALDQAEVRKHLQQQNRQPFRDLLALVLDCHPSSTAMKGIAEKNPDRWAQMLAIVARLGGYNDKLEVEGSITTRASQLSDAELEALITAKLREMGSGNTE